MGKKNTTLFDEDEEVAPAQLKINEDFAKRFEHNKKREEIHRLKEKYPEVAARLEAKMLGGGGDGTDTETSSDEEDDGYISTKKEAQILETILKIRRKEPSIYDKDAKFYSSDEEEEGEESEDGDAADKKKKKKKEKPMFLKDVMYKEAMDRAAGDISDTDSDDEKRRSDSDEPKMKTYTQEQAELKDAFLNAFKSEAAELGLDEEGDAFGGVLKTRRKASSAKAAAANSDSDSDEDEESEGGNGNGNGKEGRKGAVDEARVQELLDSYFDSGRGGERTMKEEDRFLRNYILHRGWVDGDGDGNEDGVSDDGDGGGEPADDFEDMAALAAADAFEAQYNFRFEEPGGAQLVTHPRQLEGTVRKEDDRRKRQRAEKAARKAAEEEERRAEIRRLKNLKKGQIEDKLAEVEKVAGAHAPSQALLDELLEGDFDPEAHDMAMAAAFGDDYYGCDEEDIADAQFEAELQAMAEYPTDDDEAAEGTFEAVHERLAHGSGNGTAHVDEEEEEENGEDAEGAAAAKADVKRLLEEYHRLDYEDHVGGIPTRFRYKEVAKETYGLTLEEILTMDDKELNQIMGLKSVAAPYRQGQRTQRPNYGKLNELRRERGGWQEGRGGGRGGGSGGARQGDDRMRTQQGHYDKSREVPREREDARPVATAAEKRLATFDAPKLKKKRQEGGDGDAHHAGSIQRKKAKQTEHAKQQQVAQQQAVESGMSKAQRKNIKRAAKRAAKRSDVAGGGS